MAIIDLDSGSVDVNNLFVKGITRFTCCVLSAFPRFSNGMVSTGHTSTSVPVCFVADFQP